METLNSITTSIASHLDRIQDEPFKRMLALKVDAWRSKLIVNSLEKHPEQRKFFRQTLYVPLVAADQVPCDLPFSLCKSMRSVDTIPIPMRLQGILFDFVGTVDGRTPFREASPGTITYLSAGKYSGKIVYYEWKNIAPEGWHFELLSSGVPMMRVDGIFDKPSEVFEFNCNNGVGCDYWDLPYPVSGDLLQMITQYILQVDYNRAKVPESNETEVDPNSPKNPDK